MKWTEAPLLLPRLALRSNPSEHRFDGNGDIDGNNYFDGNDDINGKEDLRSTHFETWKFLFKELR